MTVVRGGRGSWESQRAGSGWGWGNGDGGDEEGEKGGQCERLEATAGHARMTAPVQAHAAVRNCDAPGGLATEREKSVVA